jgi:hypothetical protein
MGRPIRRTHLNIANSEMSTIVLVYNLTEKFCLVANRVQYSAVLAMHFETVVSSICAIVYNFESKPGWDDAFDLTSLCNLQLHDGFFADNM